MSDEKSCVGCKYLYSKGEGYSNWTWESTSICCALDKNKNLPKEEPFDWKQSPDNWNATNKSMCNSFSKNKGEFVELDVDGENSPRDFTNDEEAIAAICKDSGREDVKR